MTTTDPAAGQPTRDQPVPNRTGADGPTEAQAAIQRPVTNPPSPAEIDPELAAEAARSLRIEHWRDGEHQTLSGIEALQHVVGESPARHWVDLVDPSPRLVGAVAAELGLHPLVAEDIEERNQRPKIELTDGHAHLVAFALRWENETVVTEEIDLVLSQTFLLTVHAPTWDPLANQHLREGVAPVMEKGVDYLTWTFLDAIVDGYFPVFDRIEDQIDELEDRIVSRAGLDTLDRLFSLKRSLVEIRHVMGSQREVFNQLTNRTLPMIAPEHVVYFRDVYDHAVHLSEEYDSFRDLVSGALDVYLSTVNNNLSLLMKRLTGITVVLAGIGAFAGIFGMSEAGLAFAGGEATGFWIVSLSIIILSLLLLGALRKIRWI